jgi:hypothetical protein
MSGLFLFILLGGLARSKFVLIIEFEELFNGVAKPAMVEEWRK